MLCVPPWRTTREAPPASASGSITVCSTSVVDPAEPMLKVYSPGRNAPGSKRSRVEPTSAPSTSAPQISAAAFTAVRCWRIKPGLARRARICSMTKGLPVIADNDSDERRICPPPSPCDPSMVMMAWFPPPFSACPCAAGYPFTHTTCRSV